MTKALSKPAEKKVIRPNPKKAKNFAQAQSEVMKKYAPVFAKLAK